jgi:hypothetical protein
VFLSLSERPVNKVDCPDLVFGRVPMFYYLVHFLAIHAAAAIGAILRDTNSRIWFSIHPFIPHLNWRGTDSTCGPFTSYGSG